MISPHVLVSWQVHLLKFLINVFWRSIGRVLRRRASGSKCSKKGPAGGGPIAILTAVDKLFEQVLSKLFEPILEFFMSAYRKLYSCDPSLVRLVEDWKQTIDTGKTVGVLSTDMSKNFDTMHPTLLLAKLQSYGFSNELPTLMHSFFHGPQRKG